MDVKQSNISIKTKIERLFYLTSTLANQKKLIDLWLESNPETKEEQRAGDLMSSWKISAEQILEVLLPKLEFDPGFIGKVERLPVKLPLEIYKELLSVSLKSSLSEHSERTYDEKNAKALLFGIQRAIIEKTLVSDSRIDQSALVDLTKKLAITMFIGGKKEFLVLTKRFLNELFSNREIFFQKNSTFSVYLRSLNVFLELLCDENISRFFIGKKEQENFTEIFSNENPYNVFSEIKNSIFLELESIFEEKLPEMDKYRDSFSLFLLNSNNEKQEEKEEEQLPVLIKELKGLFTALYNKNFSSVKIKAPDKYKDFKRLVEMLKRHIGNTPELLLVCLFSVLTSVVPLNPLNPPAWRPQKTDLSCYMTLEVYEHLYKCGTRLISKNIGRFAEILKEKDFIENILPEDTKELVIQEHIFRDVSIFESKDFKEFSSEAEVLKLESFKKAYEKILESDSLISLMYAIEGIYPIFKIESLLRPLVDRFLKILYEQIEAVISSGQESTHSLSQLFVTSICYALTCLSEYIEERKQLDIVEILKKLLKGPQNLSQSNLLVNTLFFSKDMSGKTREKIIQDSDVLFHNKAVWESFMLSLYKTIVDYPLFCKQIKEDGHFTRRKNELGLQFSPLFSSYSSKILSNFDDHLKTTEILKHTADLFLKKNSVFFRSSDEDIFRLFNLFETPISESRASLETYRSDIETYRKDLDLLKSYHNQNKTIASNILLVNNQDIKIREEVLKKSNEILDIQEDFACKWRDILFEKTFERLNLDQVLSVFSNQSSNKSDELNRRLNLLNEIIKTKNNGFFTLESLLTNLFTEENFKNNDWNKNHLQQIVLFKVFHSETFEKDLLQLRDAFSAGFVSNPKNKQNIKDFLSMEINRIKTGGMNCSEFNISRLIELTRAFIDSRAVLGLYPVQMDFLLNVGINKVLSKEYSLKELLNIKNFFVKHGKDSLLLEPVKQKMKRFTGLLGTQLGLQQDQTLEIQDMINEPVIF